MSFNRLQITCPASHLATLCWKRGEYTNKNTRNDLSLEYSGGAWRNLNSRSEERCKMSSSRQPTAGCQLPAASNTFLKRFPSSAAHTDDVFFYSKTQQITNNNIRGVFFFLHVQEWTGTNSRRVRARSLAAGQVSSLHLSSLSKNARMASDLEAAAVGKQGLGTLLPVPPFPVTRCEHLIARSPPSTS